MAHGNKFNGRFLLSANDTYKAGSTGGEATHTLTIDEMPSHAHEQYVTANPGTGGRGIRGDFTDEGTGYNAYPQGCSTDSTGGSKAHNNMPPYLVVYMWKRTA